MPTWHKLPLVPPATAADLRRTTATNYATHIHFAHPRPAGAGQLPIVEIDEQLRRLVLIDDHAHIAAEDPFPVETFDVRRHTVPDVHWFSPYSVNSSVFNYAWTNGFKIESSEIDGTSIPIPNEQFSVNQNNSQFLQGSIPLTKIRGYVPSAAAGNVVIISRRADFIPPAQPLSFTLRDLSQNVLPYFDNRNTIIPPIQLYGFSRTRRFASQDDAFTTASWTSTADPPLAHFTD